MVLSIFAAVGLSARAQQNQKSPDNALPSDAAPASPPGPQHNPVKPTPDSIAQGKKVYGYDCAMCHGVDGDGKGDLAIDMKLKLLDYRDPDSLKDKTDADLFQIIQKGKGGMPEEGDRAKPDVIWDLVNYVRSFARKDSGSKENPAAH
jgi:mono/diheme cytochrome c family protein